MSLTAKLKTADQWRTWIASIQDIADTGQIWDLIDPDREEPPPPLIEPSEPNIQRAQTDARDIEDLNELGMVKWNCLMNDYQFKVSRYENRLKSLTKMSRTIRDSVAPEHLHYIAGKRSPYEQLRRLKTVFAPSRDERMLELRGMV